MRSPTVSRVGARLPQALSPGYARAGLVHVSVDYNARTDGSRICRPGPNPRWCFTSPCSPCTSRPRSPIRGIPSAARLRRWNRRRARMAPQRRRRLTRNSTATLTWCSCCIHPARPRAPAFLASEAFSYVAGTGLAELGLTRYRLFHARLGSMSCKPFGGEIRSEDPATRPTRVTTAAVRQHDVEDGGEEPPQMEGKKHDGIPDRQPVRQPGSG